MNMNIKDIQNNIQIAKAIEDDMHEYESLDVQAAYLKNRQRLESFRKKRSITYYMLRIAAILLLPLAISTGTLSYLYLEQLGNIENVTYLEAFSAPGIVTRVQLPDSSTVWLNAESSLRYPSRFTEKNRIVHLSGEGYFEVQSDKEHPFFVSLNSGIRVKAHGTKFNVNAYDDDLLMETSLETGLVDVINGTRTILLKPNEQVVYNKEEKHFIVRPANLEEKTAWREGKMIFRNATLEDVLKQLSRRYNIDITLHRETTKDYKFRASFSTEDITQILNYLRLAAPISWSFADTKQQLDYTYPRQRIDVWLK